MSPTTLAVIFMVVVFVSAVIAWVWLRVRHTRESGNMGEDSLRDRDLGRDPGQDPDHTER